MKTVKEKWNKYLHQCVSKKACPQQIYETQAAFYAGVITMLDFMVDDVADMKDEEKGAAAIDKLNQELLNFAQEKVNESNS